MREYIANLRHLQGWQELFGYWFQRSGINVRWWERVIGSRFQRFPFFTGWGLRNGLSKAWQDTRDDSKFW